MNTYDIKFRTALNYASQVSRVLSGRYETIADAAIVSARLEANSDMEALEKVHALVDPLGVPMHEIRVAAAR
jgi:hypothetical protein